MKKNKTIGIIIIILIYLFTIASGVGIYFLLPDIITNQLLLTFLIIDVACTLIIYLFSLIFKNASIYDPYWSVAPAVILPTFMILSGYDNVFGWILIACVWIWSLRLTINCFVNFKNLETKDWRYQMLQEKHPKLYFLINLFGIHLFPTFMVFIGMLPAFMFFEMSSKTNPTIGHIIALIIILGAIVIETIADYQMYQFRKQNNKPEAIMNQGLWKNSRHPNYLGEILFWIGIYLAFASYSEVEFAVVFGTAFSPIAMFTMFVFISVPLLEKRMKQRKPGYQEYINNTNMFLIFPAKTTTKKK